MFQKMKNWLTKKINQRTYNKYSGYFKVFDHVKGVAYLEQQFQITKGKYEGLIFFFHNIGLSTPGTSISAVVVRPPNNPKLVVGEDFQDLVHYILFCIVYKEQQDLEANVKSENYEYRESYSEEPFNERTVRKKDSSIFED